MIRSLGRALAWLTLVAVLLPGPLEADPRWWWDDAAVTSDGAEKASPDLCVVSGEAGGQGGGIVLVAWQQRESPGDDWEIWITASSSGGCSFCPPVRITDNDLDDTRPRIEAAALPIDNLPLSIQVVFEQEGNAVLAHDASTVSAMLSGPAFCDRLALLAGVIPGNGQYLRLNTTDGTARRPDIDLSSMFFQFNHFHVVWEDSRDGAWDIWTTQDLIGDASGYGPATNLTPHDPPAGDALLPVVSGDTVSVNPGMDGGVSVVFLDAGTGEVLYLRSNDSGTRWSGTGVPPATPPVDPPAVITSTGPAPLSGPSLDNSDLDWGAGQIWTMAGWVRGDGSGAGANLEHRRDPTVIDVPWNPTAEHGLGPAPLAASRSATALDPNFGALSGAWSFWKEGVGPFTELVCRAGTLDTVALSIDFNLFPIAPARPPDTSLSAVRPLTHCLFDEGSFACPSARSSGEARDMAAVSERSPGAGGPGNHLVWIDTRTAATEVWYKRTDTWTGGLWAQPDSACETLTEARVRTRIDPPQDCLGAFPFPERVRRVLVYYGTGQGGPYQNAGSPIAVAPDPLLPVFVEIGGLALNTTYWIIAVPEDEARNLYPSDFDPTENRASWDGEQSVRTPASCSPDVSVLSCGISGESCADPGHPIEGNIDFGETFDVDLVFENTGSMDAVNFTADFTITNARINFPAGGVITLPSIPAGGSVPVRVNVTVDPSSGTFRCGDTLDMRIANMRADNGGPWPSDQLAGCDVMTGDGGGGCTECLPGIPNMVLVRCEMVDDGCARPVGSPGDGVPDPGETLSYEVVFRNVGTVAATEFTGNLQLLWGGAPLSGIGILPPQPVAPGAGVTHAFSLEVGDLCGDKVDLQVTGLESDFGTFTYRDVLTECDRPIGSNPLSLNHSYFTSQILVLPDDGTEVTHPEAVHTVEPIRVEQAQLWVGGTQPDPADVRLRLVGPGGGPGIDVSAAWNLNQDITAFYNDPAQGGPGPYTLYARDAAPGGGDGNVWSFQIQVIDTVADCNPCAECTPFDFTGRTAAFPEGECTLRVNWPPGSGQGTVTYNLYRDGGLLQTGLTAPTFLDAPVAWGETHRYQALCSDDCPTTIPTFNLESPEATAGDPVGPDLPGPPATAYDGTVNGDCTVTVDTAWSADCAPVALFEVLRDGAPVHASASDPFPHPDTAPADGGYVYAVRLTDEAGNVSVSPAAPVVAVDNCDPPEVCLHVLIVADLEAFNAAKPAGYFLVPPGPGDMHLDVPPAACPFASGDRVALTGGVPLTLYDVNRAARDLAVTNATASGSAELIFTFTH